MEGKKIVKSIIKNLKNNFYWKLLSIFFALLLWFVAINDTNMVITEEYSIHLTLLNTSYLDSADYVLANKKELEAKTIKLYIRTNRIDKKELDLKIGEIIASVDLKAIDISADKKLGEKLTTSIKFQVPTLSSVKLISTSASVVDIVLDKYEKREMEVSVNTIGKVSDGYETLKSITEPKTVVVSGPKSIIDKIVVLKVDVDLKNSNSDVVLERTPIAYDAEEVIVSDQVTISNQNIEVTVPVRKSEKVSINAPTYMGKVKDGYKLVDVKYAPEFIQVLGTASEIENFKSITLDPIDVTGFSKTQEVVLDLRKYLLSTNLSILNGVSHEVKVTIVIEKEEILELEIPNSQIQIKSASTDNEIIVNETDFKVTLKATEKLFKSLDTTNIKCLVDITDLDVGTYDVPIKMTLPQDIIIVGEEPTINVTISKAGTNAELETETSLEVPN